MIKKQAKNKVKDCKIIMPGLLVHGPIRFSYHFEGEIVTGVNVKSIPSCFKILMIAILNGQLYDIFLDL